MLPKEKELIYIQSYKHDKSRHRTWSKAMVIEANNERIVTVTDHANVIEADHRRWVTREPAICVFYPDRWYNIIAMIRKRGIFYYCNIASPSIYDGEALKNIDYDLDVKIDDQFNYTILDEHEYQVHAKEMNYSQELDYVLHKQLDQLIDDIKHRRLVFDHEVIYQLYNQYLTYKKNENTFN